MRIKFSLIILFITYYGYFVHIRSKNVYQSHDHIHKYINAFQINTYNNRLIIINADITVPARPAGRCEA